MDPDRARGAIRYARHYERLLRIDLSYYTYSGKVIDPLAPSAETLHNLDTMVGINWLAAALEVIS